MDLGRLCHKEGSMYDKVFGPLLVLQKECWSFAKLFLRLCVYSTVQDEFEDFIQIKRTVFINKLESYCVYALLRPFFSRQSIYWSARDICCILSDLRQNRIHLFCITFIFFLFFWKVLGTKLCTRSQNVTE